VPPALRGDQSSNAITLCFQPAECLPQRGVKGDAPPCREVIPSPEA
jgi:hypothetical protein